MTTTRSLPRRWEHDEGMDYSVAVTEAVQHLSKRVHDEWKAYSRQPTAHYAHPGSNAVVHARFDVESVTLTYWSSDLFGAQMSATLHKTDPHTVAEIIVSMLDHGRPTN